MSRIRLREYVRLYMPYKKTEHIKSEICLHMWKPYLCRTGIAMAQKRIYTHNEVIDTLVGVKGTAQREAYDLSIERFLVGQTIREIREKRNLTQEDLGNLIGVKKAQISRIENGKNLTIATILKVFKALDVDAKLHISDHSLALS